MAKKRLEKNMLNEITQDASERMQKSLDALITNFKKIRTGRAHPSILEGIQVPYYGSDVPLSQVANVSVEDGRTLSIIPWEKPMVPVIEKAIMTSNLGLNPATAGENIRVPMPPLTEETRKGYIKRARQEAEGARVAVRNIRRDANGDLKDLLKEKEITEDDLRRGEDQIQKITDKFVVDVDALLEQKEKDLMEI
jgi:ribosome recycling factor